MNMPKCFVRIFTSRSFRAEARRQRAEVETRSEAQSPEGKSASISASNPDFSASFAALTPVEMTSFIQGEIKTQRYGGQPFTSSERRATRDSFTLVELLVALIVSSIILAAVATLAFAMSSANDATDDTSSKQAQVRFATLRISELIRQCKLICNASVSEMAIWKTDDGDNRIDLNELVFIQIQSDPVAEGYLRLCLYEFPSTYSGEKSLADIATLSPADYGIEPVTIISECNDVQFNFYDSNSVLITSSPWTRTKFISIEFKILENGVEHQYQINNVLRCWAGNLLNSTGTSIVSDDD